MRSISDWICLNEKCLQDTSRTNAQLYARHSQRQWLGAPVENRQIFTISKDATSLFASQLTDDSKFDQMLKRFTDGGKRKLELF